MRKIAVKISPNTRKAAKLFAFLCGVFLTLLIFSFNPQSTGSKDQASDIQFMNASWYGPRFHGRKTASGTKFDMRKISAAHKSLPLGTKVLLINPENQTSLVVPITDRGPYIKDRDIDLSLAAAEILGFRERGLASFYAVVVE